MPDPTMSDAIAEAYASAPLGAIVWETVELWHPAWAEPIRVVRDRVALEARIEDGADRNAGEMVTFVAYPFDLVPPDMSATSAPQATLEIDNVSREIGQQMDLAIMDGRPTEVIWRSYLSGNQDLGPEHDPPIRMQMPTVTLTPLKVRAVLGFRDLINQAFPTMEYDSEAFPGLTE